MKGDKADIYVSWPCKQRNLLKYKTSCKLKVYQFIINNCLPKISRLSDCLIVNFAWCFLLISCTGQNKITGLSNKNTIEVAAEQLINTPNLSAAHIGICIYDANENKTLYNFNSDKYFIPASNTKIITCYAAMKYLGDSLNGLKVFADSNRVLIAPTGDPTILHSDFANQPVIDFLKKQPLPIFYIGSNWKENSLGSGWSWDDYQDYYAAERSALPVYGNTVTASGTRNNYSIQPSYFSKYFSVLSADTGLYINSVQRSLIANIFEATQFGNEIKKESVPFITSDSLSICLLNDTLHKTISQLASGRFIPSPTNQFYYIHSQPTDSLLKIMMHRSDNFYAEQSLLMVSNQVLGIMNDEKIIDTLLNSDFMNMPQKPRWVDGSGLSRYNLFTPQDFVWILEKMRNEFTWHRITTIFPSGGNGTLAGYYKNSSNRIFAKSGTLSNNLSLSGFIITQKNKTFIFSVMIGNHMDKAADVRAGIEKMLTSIIENN